MSEFGETYYTPPFSEVFFAELQPKKLSGNLVALPDFHTNITFLLLNHSAENGMPDTAKTLIEENDVILLEGAGWKPEQETVLKRLSEGDETQLQEYEFSRDNFRQELGKALLGSGKAVLYCDKPYTRKFEAEIREVGQSPPFSRAANVQHGINLLASKYKQTYQSVLGRDKYILANVYKDIARSGIINRSESPARTLFIIGGGHASLPFMIRKTVTKDEQQDRHSVKEVFIEGSPTYQIQLYREFLAGKNFSEELLLKDMLVRAMKRKTIDDFKMLEESTIEEARDYFSEFILHKPVDVLGSTAINN